MYYYRIGKLTLQSCVKLKSFLSFSCDPAEPDITIEETQELPPSGKDHSSGRVLHRKINGGYFFHPPETEKIGLYVNDNYTRLRILATEKNGVTQILEWYARIAMECWLARNGYVSLHSAAIEVGSEAYAFTGPSGMGKSTRATACLDGLGGQLISGDRPLIGVNDRMLYGVPWDGKEQCFRNVRYPIKAIMEVRRSESVYIRNMSFQQRRKLLMRQCFIPMWDLETAAIQIANISRMAADLNIIRVFCGPNVKDVQALFSALQKQKYLKEETDMKAKNGFVLRHVVDEYILMPTGDNIGVFNGTVLLNEVSAFVWEKLQNPLSRDDLLKAILDEFEVEKAVASADLDALLVTLKDYGVIEDD